MAMAITFREHIQRAIFENCDNCDNCDQKTSPDQHKDNDDDKQRTPSNGNPREIVTLLTFLTIQNLKA